MKLYFKHALMHIKAAMEYRASFTLLAFGAALSPLTAVLAFFLLFERFGSIAGWTFGQAVLCFAVTNLSFYLSETFARGFDMFSSLVRSGNFDRLLVLPRGIILSTFCSDFGIQRLGRLVFAFGVLGYAIVLSGVQWTLLKGVTLAMMLLAGVLVFSGLFIAFAAFCFVTIEGMEVANIFTYGGRELASYPLDVFARPVRNLFTFLIPFATFNYLPLLFLLDRAPWFYCLIPLLSIPFFFICCGIFVVGVRRYRSTG